MRFNLVDRILDYEPGKRITLVKHLTLGEEYLADHFPTFPVMPGVLMLQTVVEAGAWLLRLTDDYRYSVIVMREAKNVKYGTFMEPGKSLVVTAEMLERDESADPRTVSLKAHGECEGASAVTARVTLTQYNLRERNPDLQSADERIVRHLKRQFAVLRGQCD